jgi:hypothetical protein
LDSALDAVIDDALSTPDRDPRFAKHRQIQEELCEMEAKFFKNYTKRLLHRLTENKHSYKILIRLVQQPGWLSHKSCGFSG